MKKQRLQISLLMIGFFMSIPIAFSQDVGATFCWQYQEIYGGHRGYIYNKSIVTDNLPSTTTPEWIGMTQWWENLAEEIDYSGIDFIALLSRGDQPNAPDRGNGNPTHIAKMVTAMTTRGTTNFKLAIFDDCPNSWTGSKNWNESGGTDYNTTTNKFDCSVTANYKYIWDYNLRPAIAAIPDNKRYKIDGRMAIFFWSVKPTWMSNTQGNLSKILNHIRTKCQTEFGFVPYIIIDKDWLDNDSTLSTATVDQVHGWFSAAGNTSYTLETWNGKKAGALCPGFGKPTETTAFLDPSMGTTDNGKRLKTGLTATVDSGARTTLVEGFTDSAEGAALWRSNDSDYYDYPNQRLNILRRYTSDPYPTNLKVEAEACDFNSDVTATNTGGKFLKAGNLDVEECSDQYSGWNVTDTQANEWMEWRELPLLKETKFKLRYKSTAAASIKFSVDGTALSTISLASTAGAWTTIDAGNYSTANNSLHTVRLTIVSGSPDINYFSRVNAIVVVTSVAVTPATATITDGATQQLTATVAPSNASNKTVTWTSSNTAVATVNASGLVTAVNPGTATITATTQDGAKTDTSVITVTGVSNVMQNLQAESATYVGAVLATNQTGYKGTGFVDFVNDTGDYIQWSVNVPTAGTYELSFRYALPNGGRPLELKVNGTAKIASFDFPATGLWNTWSTVSTSQTLNAGNNTIRLTTIGSNGGNIDLLSVAPYVDTCDALSTWDSAAANALTYTSTNKKQGTGAVQMVGSGTEEFKKVFSPAFNSGTTVANGLLNFWYYISDVSKTGTVIVELGSGGAADVNELSWSLSGLVNGWNEISLPLSSANQTGTANLNAINWFRLFSSKTASITTRIDAIQLLNSATVASSQRKANTLGTVENSLTNAATKSITVYPNPYKDGTLSLDILGFEASKAVQLKITNLLGQVIHQEILTDTAHKELNLSGRLNEAVYFISLEDGDNKIVKKLMVK
ncbi:DUF5010 domain-containing protein [Flavobacterium nackdongense]|uniref:DUF5010 domain-containing protein n=1 Tax=Flavobacterium nackdongense TaxID=2547394 RepID=A0A4P6YB23_9FLAO|nr:DUF5010 domain-containing protein [Flavobacterium nackdongense]QBN17847.1 DUF5010 domain-containing protein [Flavobacterium nackdongense]